MFEKEWANDNRCHKSTSHSDLCRMKSYWWLWEWIFDRPHSTILQFCVLIPLCVWKWISVVHKMFHSHPLSTLIQARNGKFRHLMKTMASVGTFLNYFFPFSKQSSIASQIFRWNARSFLPVAIVTVFWNRNFNYNHTIFLR